MGIKRIRLGRALFVAGMLVFASSALRAQAPYPNRPIQLLVPVPPGGAADFLARIVGGKLADALGQPVVISNRGGAGGTIASASVAKAEPDGHTLLLNSIKLVSLDSGSRCSPKAWEAAWIARTPGFLDVGQEVKGGFAAARRSQDP